MFIHNKKYYYYSSFWNLAGARATPGPLDPPLLMPELSKNLDSLILSKNFCFRVLRQWKLGKYTVYQLLKHKLPYANAPSLTLTVLANLHVCCARILSRFHKHNKIVLDELVAPVNTTGQNPSYLLFLYFCWNFLFPT